MLTNVKAGRIRCIEILCIENKAEVWGAKPPAAGGQWGFEGGALDAATILQLFSIKNTHLRHSLV